MWRELFRSRAGLRASEGLDMAQTLIEFPRPLRLCRRIEPWLARLPLGAQYLVLAEKMREDFPHEHEDVWLLPIT